MLDDTFALRAGTEGSLSSVPELARRAESEARERLDALLTDADRKLARILDIAPLSGSEWLSVALWSALPAVVGQISKLMRPSVTPGASGRS